MSKFCDHCQLYAHVYKYNVFAADEIVDRALLALTSREQRKYDEILNNCEHFATKIIRGHGESNQSKAVIAGFEAGLGAGTGGAVGGAALATVAGLSNVVIAETVTIPLWGSSILGAMGFTQTAVVTSSVTAFQAGVVTLGTVGGMAIAGALLAGICIGCSTYFTHKRSESYDRSSQQRQKAQSAGKKPERLLALGYDCEAFNVAFCGGTGRGKSSCINAVVGQDVARDLGCRARGQPRSVSTRLACPRERGLASSLCTTCLALAR